MQIYVKLSVSCMQIKNWHIPFTLLIYKTVQIKLLIEIKFDA